MEVQIDDGTWNEARLGENLTDDSWRQWLFTWNATPGTHVIRVRATDSQGNAQTPEQQAPSPDGATGYHTIRVKVAG